MKTKRVLLSALSLLLSKSLFAADPLSLTSNTNGIICTSSGIILTIKNCPANASYEVSNGTAVVSQGTSGGGEINLSIQPNPQPGTTSITYTASCKVDASTITKATTEVKVGNIDVRWVNVGKSKTATNPSGQGFATSDWPTINPTSGPTALNSTESNRTILDYTGPRYWTLEAFYCLTGAPKSMEFVLTNETTSQTYKTVEENAPWFLFGNDREEPRTVPNVYHRLWAVDDENYGWGNQFTSTGIPKGKYTLKVRAISVGAVEKSQFPSKRIADTEPGNTLATSTYYFDIAPNQANRMGALEKPYEEKDWAFAFSNPVSHTVMIGINGEKGNEVKLQLFDAIGRPVMSRIVTPESEVYREGVNVSEEPVGIYFMKVISPSKNTTLKIIKQPN